MTLILGMSKAEGIYLSTDYRVTDARTKRLVDDESVKHLTIHLPPVESGPKALLGYAGIASLPDGTATGDWIRETLRGESEPFDQSMAHLRQRLDRDFAPLGVELFVNLLVNDGRRRYMGGLSNVKMSVPGDPSTTYRADDFGYEMRKLTGTFAFATGSGAAKVISDGHLDLLKRQLSVKPREPHDHMKLLASVNRKVASKVATVSPHCHVAYLNGDDSTSPQSFTFAERGEQAPFAMPTLLFGIDLDYFTRHLHEQFGAVMRGEDFTELDPGEADEHLRRRE